MSTATLPKPATMSLNPEALPDDLIMREARFVVWGWTWNPGKGKWDKPPMRPTDGRAASVTNAADHTDLARALFAVRAHGFDGIGLVLQQGLGVAGIDLDKCRDATTGVIESWAQAIIDRFRSYWEPSASGTGIRIFVRGQLPPGRRRGGQIEVYEDGRYLTINGNPGPGASRHFEERQAELDIWHAETFGVQQAKVDRPIAPLPATLDDTTLLEKAFTAKNGCDFERRHQGVLLLENSSDDDWAYLMALAFWTQCDPGQMRRIALASGRVRDKWLSRRPGGDWLDYNIANACTEQHEVYDPQRLSGARVVFTVPDDGDVCDVAQIAAAVAARDAMIVRLEATIERLNAQVDNCGTARKRLEAENLALRGEVDALEAAAAYPDQTIGGVVVDLADYLIARAQKGDTIAHEGREAVCVVQSQIPTQRSYATLNRGFKKILDANHVPFFEREIHIINERIEKDISVPHIYISDEERTDRGKLIRRLLPPAPEPKRHGGKRTIKLPEFTEPVEGPIKRVTEKKAIWSSVLTEKTLLVETLDSITEHFDPEGMQMTADEVDTFKESIGLKVKAPAYRPVVQLPISEADQALTAMPRAAFDAWLDEEPVPIPLHGKRCAMPGCVLPPGPDGMCSRHESFAAMTGAD